jgi:hypothetical protein
VTACAQVLPPNARGVLVSDLDCTGEVVGVTLGRNARLSLGGFTLISGFNGIECQGSCTVTGPGSISGGQAGVVGDKRILISGVTISDAENYGVQGSMVDLEGSTVIGAAFFAVSATRSARITSSSLDGVFGGISAGRAILKGSTVTADTFGISASTISLKSGSTVATGAGPDARALRTGKRPQLSDDSSCTGVSYNWKTKGSWGVCSLD